MGSIWGPFYCLGLIWEPFGGDRWPYLHILGNANACAWLVSSLALSAFLIFTRSFQKRRNPWGLRPKTPVPFKHGYCRGLTGKPAYGSYDSDGPKQWPVTTLVSGGCDSSRLGSRVPIWPAEAATAANFKGGVWEGVAIISQARF